jgi:hypothetical protein
LNSLEEAYQYELKAVKDRLRSTQAEAAKVDAGQFEMLKRLNGFTQFPGVFIHGLGRVFGFSKAYSGNFPVSVVKPGTRDTAGYLDLVPHGVVSRQVAWSAMIRVQSGLQPEASLDTLTLRRVTMEFDPEWFSATLGDFEEAYTPLLLWNRNSQDLRYKPEMIRRTDALAKYEQFLDKEPALPFRGLKVETALKWPGPGPLDQVKTSVFAHMIRNGFDDISTDAAYYGPYLFTDWIFAGSGGLRLKKWRLGGGTSLQLAADAYGVMLDEDRGSDRPGSPYRKFDPATWAHRYRIGSVKPSMRLGFGNEFYAGAEMETAAVLYEDDQQDQAKDIKDFALLGGPFLQKGGSRISFNFLQAGPYYYSPLAQTRQDDLTGPSAGPLPGTTGLFTPDLFHAPVRSRSFLSNVPRPGALYGYYDRTRDNTFPYGLSTPNRRGGGLELDLKTLKQDSLRIAGSAYRVRETDANAVVNTAGTFLVPVDAPPGQAAPIREFTYVNIGPSFNFGPHLGWKRDLEVGTNVRYEKTRSSIGTLTCRWVLGAVRAGLLSFWDISACYSRLTMDGSEAGMDHTLRARYSYVFDNKDLGRYSVFRVNGAVKNLGLSNDLHLGDHSRVFLDLDWTEGDILPYAPSLAGNFDNLNLELTYEIQF